MSHPRFRRAWIAALPLALAALAVWSRPRPEPASTPSEPPPAPAVVRHALPGLEEPGLEAAPVSERARLVRELSSDVLKERDGVFGYASPYYRATLRTDEVTVVGGGAPLSYALEEIRVGGRALPLARDVRPAHVPGTRAVSYARGAVEERYTLRRSALEQDFVFHELPLRGEIVVKGRVSTSLEPPADGAKGKRLSFRARGEESLYVADALAVDGKGRTLPLEMAYAGGELAYTIPADWVAKAALPITLDPLIGSPTLIRPNVLNGTTGTDLVWSQELSAYLFFFTEYFGADNSELAVQKLSMAGQALGGPVVLDTYSAPEPQWHSFRPVVAFSAVSGRYLVAWHAAPVGDPTTSVIWGRFLDVMGSPLGTPFRLSSGSSAFEHSLVADDSGRWLMAHAFFHSQSLKWVYPDGTVTVVGSDPGMVGGRAPRVAFENGLFLVSWIREGFLVEPVRHYARLMDATGAFVTPVTEIASYGPSTLDLNPAALGANGAFTYVWIDWPTKTLRARMIQAAAGPELTFLTPAIDLHAPLANAVDGRTGYPDLAFIPETSEWLAVYVQKPGAPADEDVYLARFTAAGVVGSDRLTQDSAQSYDTQVAWSPGAQEALLTWTSYFPPTNLYAQRWSRSQQPPPSPVLTATPGNGRVDLEWTASPGASTYVVKRSVQGGPFTVLAAGLTVTTYADLAVSNGTSYAYVVSALSSGGESPDSNVVTAVPLAPSIQALFVVGNTALGTGDAAAEARLRALGFQTVIRTGSTATSADADGKALVVISSTLAPGSVDEKFRHVPVPVINWESRLHDGLGMTGAGGGNAGTFGAQTSLVVAGAHPLAAGLTGTVAVTTAPRTLSWGVPGPAAVVAATLVGQPGRAAVFGYEAGAAMPGLVAPARRVGFFLEDLTADALTPQGLSLFDAAVRWAVGSAAGAPLPPSGLTATASAGRVELSWFPSEGATSYTVQRSTAPGGPYAPIQTGLTGFSFADQGLSDGVTYYYVVTALNGAGESGASNEAFATPQAVSPLALFVVGADPLGAGDAAVMTRLEALGYSVLVKTGPASASSDADGKALVLISSTVAPGTVVMKFRTSTRPVLSWENELYEDLGLVRRHAGTRRRESVALIVNPSHPLAAGRSGSVTVSAPETFSWGEPGAQAAVVATLDGDANRALIFGYEAGAPMEGLNAPARRVGFFLEDLTAAALTPAGWALFDAAVRWAADSTPGAPAAPSNLSATAGPASVSLAWGAAPGASGYTVKRSTSSNTFYAPIASGVTGTSYVDAAVTPGTTYYYVVSATAGGVESANSNEAAATPGSPRPALFVVGSLPLSPDDAAVEARLRGLGFAVTPRTSAEATTADAAGMDLVLLSSTLSAGAVNTKFRNVAVPVINWDSALYDDLGMVGGPGKDAGTTSGQTTLLVLEAGHPLSAGLSGTVAVTTRARTFSWGVPNANAVRAASLAGTASRSTVFGYEAGAAMPELVAPARRVGFFLEDDTATSLNANGWALFDAAVRWAAGTAPPPPPPAPPTGLVATADVGSVALAWTAPPEPVQYNVYRSLAPGGPYGAPTNPAPLGSTAYVDAPLAASTTFYYIVRSVNASGVESANSNEASTTTPAVPTPPAAPTILTVTPTAASVGLTWTAPAGTGGYRVYRTTDPAAAAEEFPLLVAQYPGTTFSHPADPNTFYRFVVRAFNAAGDSPPSNVVATTTLLDPPQVTATALRWNWTRLTVPPPANFDVGQTGLAVDRSLDGGATWSPVQGFVPVYVVDDLGVPAASTILYRLALQNQVGVPSAFTDPIAVGTPALPAPSITAPATGALLTTGTSAVSGTSALDGLTLTLLVDGAPRGTSTTGADGAWALSASPAIPDGERQLSARVADAFGNVSADAAPVAVRVDTRAPDIDPVSPPAGTTVPPSTLIRATWTDAGSGVDPATATLAFDTGPVAGGFTADASGLTYAATLPAGARTVTVTVRDVAGHLASRTWSFSVGSDPDTQPPLLSISPANGTFVSSPRPPLEATGTDEGGSGVVSIALYLDGTPVNGIVSSAGPGALRAVFTPPNDLSEGVHALRAEATDAAGQSSIEMATFTVDSIVPRVVATVVPQEGEEEFRTLSVTLSDFGSGIVESSRRVLVDLVDRWEDGVYADGTWTLTDTFTPGNHSVVAEARDHAGNLGQGTAAFVVEESPEADTTSPTVTLVFPDQGTIFQAGGRTMPVVVDARDAASGDGGIARVELLVSGSAVQVQTSADARLDFYYVFNLVLEGVSPLVVEARAVDLAGNQAISAPVSVGLTGEPTGTVRRFALDAPAQARAGESLTVTATPIGQTGTPVSYEGFLQVRSTASTPPSLFLPVASTASIQVPLTLSKIGVGVVMVYDSANPGVSGFAVMEVLPGPPSQVDVDIVREELLTPNSDLSEATATVTDAAGNPISGSSVTWTVEFFQNGTSLGTGILTSTTNAVGVASLPGVVLPANTTALTISASVSTGGGTSVGGSLSSPVHAEVVFEVLVGAPSVEAGMPLSLVIRALDPVTGAILRDYVGTAHIYRADEEIHGPSTFVGYGDGQPAEPTQGEFITVQFTSEDQGVKVVSEGLVLTGFGETYLVASTVMPTFSDMEELSLRDAEDEEFGTVVLQDVDQPDYLVGGFSNEVMVLPGRPARFSVVSLEQRLPVEATAILVDRFGNPVFLEPVRFEFVVNGSPGAPYEDLTDVIGRARGSGPYAHADIDNTVHVTVSAPRHPEPQGVPEQTRTLTIVRSGFSGITHLSAGGDPEPIEMGVNGQAVSDVSITVSGEVFGGATDVSVKVHLKLEGEEEGLGERITFSGGTVSSSTSDAQVVGYSVNGTEIVADVFVQVANPPGFQFTLSVSDILVDVPGDGRILERHPHGVLYVSGLSTEGGSDLAPIGRFAKTLQFVGSVVPAGNSSFSGGAGVFVLDPESATHALVTNPGLILQNVSDDTAGTFRVRVFDTDLEASEDLFIRLQSSDSEGAGLPGGANASDVLLPLRTVLSEAGSGTVLESEPVLAVSNPPVPESSTAMFQERLLLRADSGVPADPNRPSRIDVQVLYPDGRPASGASVHLRILSATMSPPPSLTQPEPTNGEGWTFAELGGSRPGAVEVAAQVSAPAENERYTGFSLDSEPEPLRVVFTRIGAYVVARPAGVVTATLVRGSGEPSASTAVEGFSPTRATAVGLEVFVRSGEGSGLKPAAGAVLRGTPVEVEARLVPSYQSMEDLGLALIVDDGRDNTVAERPDSEDERILDSEHPDVSRESSRILWSVSSDESPFQLGTNRVRVVVQNRRLAHVEEPTGKGPVVAAPRFLCYDDQIEIDEDEGVGDGIVENYVALGGYDDENRRFDAERSVFYLDKRLLLSFGSSASDDQISAVLSRNGLAPLAVTPPGAAGFRIVEALAPHRPDVFDFQDEISPAGGLQGVSVAADLAYSARRWDSPDLPGLISSQFLGSASKDVPPLVVTSQASTLISGPGLDEPFLEVYHVADSAPLGGAGGAQIAQDPPPDFRDPAGNPLFKINAAVTRADLGDGEIFFWLEIDGVKYTTDQVTEVVDVATGQSRFVYDFRIGKRRPLSPDELELVEGTILVENKIILRCARFVSNYLLLVDAGKAIADIRRKKIAGIDESDIYSETVTLGLVEGTVSYFGGKVIAFVAGKALAFGGQRVARWFFRGQQFRHILQRHFVRKFVKGRIRTSLFPSHWRWDTDFLPALKNAMDDAMANGFHVVEQRGRLVRAVLEGRVNIPGSGVDVMRIVIDQSGELITAFPLRGKGMWYFLPGMARPSPVRPGGWVDDPFKTSITYP